MAQHEKGQRVTTPHGAGTVSGFECFDRDGKSLPPAQVDKGGARYRDPRHAGRLAGRVPGMP